MKPDRDGQRAVVQLFRSLGASVFPMNRGGKSHLPKGFPDLVILWKPVGVLFWECKRPTGKRSPEQEAFAELCGGATASYGWGNVEDAKEFLRDLALL